MKQNSLSVLCLSLLLFHSHFTLAKKGSFGKGFSSKKVPGSNRVNTNRNQGSGSQGKSPKQPGQTNQGGQPSHSGRPGYPGSYPQYPGGGGSPYGHGYGGYGGHPGGYMNHNPKNRILSPGYGGSYGYGGYGYRGGSPFSNSVQGMGMSPNDNSRVFGHRAVMAATGGAVAGMALGYGLGRHPRPAVQFHSPQEEYHYNHYMYRKYGVKSTDTNDYSRDYKYSPTPQTYDQYMDSCMKRTDLLPVKNQQPNNKPAATTTTTTTVFPLTADTGRGSNTTKTNSTVEDNSSTSGLSTPRPLNQPNANPGPPTSQVLKETTTDEDDDDTVGIAEIGYPALIKQMKVRKCLELYLVYSDKYLKRVSGGVQGLQMGSQGLLAVVTSTILILLNSNMLILLR